MKKKVTGLARILQVEVERLQSLLIKIQYLGIDGDYLPDAQPPDRRWICTAPRGLTLHADGKWGRSSFPQRFRTIEEALVAGVAAEPWWEAVERP